MAIVAIPMGLAFGDTLKDDAALFGASAKQQAEAIIAEIGRDFQREVRVEAYRQVPADRRAEFAKTKANQDRRRRLLKQWADERAEAVRSTGLFIFCFAESPSVWYVQVEGNADARLRDFKEEDEIEVRRVVDESFKAGNYDEGLVNGLQSAQAAFVANQKKVKPPPAAQPQESATKFHAPPVVDSKASQGQGWFWPIVGVGFALWIVVGLVRAQAASAPEAFLPRFLDGMFGSSAGGWLSHTLLGIAAPPVVGAVSAPGQHATASKLKTVGDPKKA
jgi:hypothetical protein